MFASTLFKMFRPVTRNILICFIWPRLEYGISYVQSLVIFRSRYTSLWGLPVVDIQTSLFHYQAWLGSWNIICVIYLLTCDQQHFIRVFPVSKRNKGSRQRSWIDTLKYSKTCVQRPLKIDKTMILMTNSSSRRSNVFQNIPIFCLFESDRLHRFYCTTPDPGHLKNDKNTRKQISHTREPTFEN